MIFKAEEAFMADDVLINKAAAIERCVARAREEYQADPNRFAANFSRQPGRVGTLFVPTRI